MLPFVTAQSPVVEEPTELRVPDPSEPRFLLRLPHPALRFRLSQQEPAEARPVRPDRVLDERYRAAAEHVLEGEAPPLPEVERADAERRLDVRYQDIDEIQHVTNSSYLAWAVEAVPEETWRRSRLAAADTQFLAECRYGGRVLSRLARLGEREFAHAIVREGDGKVLARLRTVWTPRETGS